MLMNLTGLFPVTELLSGILMKMLSTKKLLTTKSTQRKIEEELISKKQMVYRILVKGSSPFLAMKLLVKEQTMTFGMLLIPLSYLKTVLQKTHDQILSPTQALTV